MFLHPYNNKEALLSAIEVSEQKGADVLLGGVSWFDTAVQIGNGLFWVDRFNATQFTIIFNNFYNTLLSTTFTEHDSADFKIRH